MIGKVYEVWYNLNKNSSRENLRVIAEDIPECLKKTIKELDKKNKNYEITNIRIRNEYMGIY